MPKNKENGQGILEEAQEAFINSSINEVGGFLANVAVSIIPIPGASFIKSPLVAAFRTAGCSMRNKTKRKAESDSAEEIEFGEKEGPDGFQCVYDKNEIINKRPRIVDNFVGREEELRRLEEKFSIIAPQTVENFIGREKEMQDLEANFKKNCSMQVLTSQVSITGLGGIGKTQLAAKFVEKNKEEYKNNFWIDAEKYCMTDSFRQLAKKTEVSLQTKEGKEKNVKCLANDVYEKLNNEKTLIVFDNVDDYDSVKDLLPSPDHNEIHVLITSRYNKWENTGVHPVELGVFTPKESIGFIKKELKIDNDKEAEKLHNKLQGLPLALQQAFAYIKQQRTLNSNFGIQDYLEKYDKSYEETERLLDLNLNECNNDPYMKTVMTTWKVTLDKIANNTECGNEAIRILSVIAYLVPDNIQNSMFSRLVEENKVAGPINLLRNYSMINQGSKADLSNIHRLVQEVIRIDLKSKREEEIVLSNAFDVLNKRHNTRSNSELSISNEDYKTMSAILVCMHASNHDSLHERIVQLFKSLINKEKEQTRAIKEGKKIINNGESFLRYAVQENNVELVNLILKDVQNRWDNSYTQNLFIEFVNNDDAKKSEIIKFLISHIKDIDRIDVIDNSNCMKVIEVLAKLRKFNREQKFKYLVKAIEYANLDVVRFILGNEPNLVKEKLKDDCSAEDNDGRRLYFVEKGSSISKLAREVGDSSQKCNNIKKIIKLIEEKIRDLDRKEMDVHHEKQPLTLGSELQSKTVGDTSDDGWELMDIPEYTVVNSGDSTPKNTLHTPSVTCGGQIHSRRC